MLKIIKDDLALRGRAALDGRFEAVLGQYNFPLPMFLEGARTVLASSNDLLPALAILHADLLRRKIIRLIPEIIAIDLPRAGRFRTWVRWQETQADLSAGRISQVVYYCRQTEGALKTEMMDYTLLSNPDLREAILELPLSA